MHLSEEERNAAIEAKMREYAANIDEFDINQPVYDTDGSACRVVEKTKNSICVFLKAKTEHGIDCTQWFDMRSFNDRFKKEYVAPKAKQPKQEKQQKETNKKSSLDQFMEGNYKPQKPL